MGKEWKRIDDGKENLMKKNSYARNTTVKEYKKTVLGN